MYNIVNLRNRWAKSGLLENLKSSKQEIELASCLEKCGKILLKMDNGKKTPQHVDALTIMAIVNIYNQIHVRKYVDSEVQFKLLTDKLRMDEHKLDVREIIELSHYTYDNFVCDEGMKATYGAAYYDYDITQLISQRYVIKHGTV